METISNLIRPGTLAVHLTANITAGHLLLTLLGNNGPSLRHALLTVLITAQIVLLILEAYSSSYPIICIHNPKNPVL
jgi:F-type H+-transporting ATPase subunit a